MSAYNPSNTAGPVANAVTPRLNSPTRNMSTQSLGGPPPMAGANGRLLTQATHPMSQPGWPPSVGGILSPSNSSATLLHQAVPPSAHNRSPRSPVRHHQSQQKLQQQQQQQQQHPQPQPQPQQQYQQHQQHQQQQGGGPVPAMFHMGAATPGYPGTNNTAASCNSSRGGTSCNVNLAAVKSQPPQVSAAAESALQVEIARRQAAEGRIRELEALVSKLRGRISTLEERRAGSPRRGPDSPTALSAERRRGSDSPRPGSVERIEDPIDRAICAYLERNPDFPVSIQKVARNYYVFGDRGTVYVTQRGEHIVVRVGGGFKSLQVFMDERALMVQQANNSSVLSEKSQSQTAAVAA